MQSDSVAPIAHVIQLSVAPVFLLTGIAALLGVLTGRPARIVERARFLERSLMANDKGEMENIHDQLKTLAMRARWINKSIALCVTSAILVATVIMSLFASSFWGRDYSVLVASLFITAMLALIGGLVFFMREIYLATSSLRIGAH
jgi:hypothetical protein